MSLSDSLSYTVSLEVAVAAQTAFEFLADPLRLGRWALGCFEVQPADSPGLFKGRSLFDQSQAWFHLETDDQRLLVDFHLGDAQTRQPRISARVVPGPVYGGEPNQCIVTMTAWRTKGMSAHRWQRLQASHDAEIYLIQAQLENRAAG